MFARLTRFQVRLERIDKARQIFKESILPANRLQQGYKGTYLFTNQKTGEGIVLTLWKSEEDVIASEENHHYQEQLVKIMNTFSAPPVREGYEVEHFEFKE